MKQTNVFLFLNFQSHLQDRVVAAPKPNYICGQCGMSFPNQSNYNQHVFDLLMCLRRKIQPKRTLDMVRARLFLGKENYCNPQNDRILNDGYAVQDHDIHI